MIRLSFDFHKYITNMSNGDIREFSKECESEYEHKCLKNELQDTSTNNTYDYVIFIADYLKKKYNLSDSYCMTDEFGNFCNTLAEGDYTLLYWYGLNRDDTFLKKLRHFTERQFQFEHVSSLDIQQKFAILKGQLFLPNVTAVTIPAWIQTARRLGKWGHTIPQQPMYHLTRHEWICPNLQATSAPAIWWCNDLYYDFSSQQSYMYRQPALIDFVYKCYNELHFKC